MCTKSNWFCPVSLQQSGIWAVICTACRLELRANNSSVHILLNPVYGMQWYIGECEHWYNTLILYLGPASTSQVHQRSPGNTGAATAIMLSFSTCVHIIVTVRLPPSVQLSNLICFILIPFISCMHLLSVSNI